MDRRQFVASSALVALGTSGCLDRNATAPRSGDDDANGDEQEPADGDDEDDPDSDGTYPRVDPAPLDDLEPLTYDVSVASAPTADSPLTIDLALRNAGEETITYGERRTAMFWAVAGDDDFSLYPRAGVEDRYEYTDGVWWLPEGFATTMEYQTATLDPDETHSESLVVLHDPVEEDDDLRALPTSLEFEVELSIATGESDDMPDGTDVSWGFRVLVDDG